MVVEYSRSSVELRLKSLQGPWLLSWGHLFHSFASKLCYGKLHKFIPALVLLTRSFHHSLSMHFTFTFLRYGNLALRALLTPSSCLMSDLQIVFLPSSPDFNTLSFIILSLIYATQARATSKPFAPLYHSAFRYTSHVLRSLS